MINPEYQHDNGLPMYQDVCTSSTADGSAAVLEIESRNENGPEHSRNSMPPSYSEVMKNDAKNFACDASQSDEEKSTSLERNHHYDEDNVINTHHTNTQFLINTRRSEPEINSEMQRIRQKSFLFCLLFFTFSCTAFAFMIMLFFAPYFYHY